MEKLKFYREQTGHSVTDLENKMVEAIVQLHEDFGGAEKTNEVLFRMFELSFSNATAEELQEFTKIQGAYRSINKMIAEHPEAMGLLIEEKKEYEQRNR